MTSGDVPTEMSLAQRLKINTPQNYNNYRNVYVPVEKSHEKKQLRPEKRPRTPENQTGNNTDIKLTDEDYTSVYVCVFILRTLRGFCLNTNENDMNDIHTVAGTEWQKWMYLNKSRPETVHLRENQ